MRVQHRHIIYIQGYDPRGLAQYYRMFRTELRKFGRLYQLQTTISRPKVAADDEIASWTIDTKAEDWQTRTAYDFLRFEDFIQQDLASPIWRTVFSAVWIYWRLVFAGTIARFGSANWRFATFITYPHVMLLLEAACVAAIAFVFEKGLNTLGIPDIFSITIAAALFVVLLGTVLKYTENATYVLYLLCDTIWTWEFSHRERPEWDQRIDRFAQHLANVAKSTDAEEIVIVGHSSGSFLSTEMLARALKLDPALGRHGPRIVLLTIGGNFPIVGYHTVLEVPRASAACWPSTSIDWIDARPAGRDELLPVHRSRAMASTRRRGATGRAGPIRDIIRRNAGLAGGSSALHFQFVMASELPNAGFFMISLRPGAAQRAHGCPDAALDVATDSGVRDRAWKIIEAATAAAKSADNLTKVEPSARRSG